LSFWNRYSVMPLPSTRIVPRPSFLASTAAGDAADDGAGDWAGDWAGADPYPPPAGAAVSDEPPPPPPLPHAAAKRPNAITLPAILEPRIACSFSIEHPWYSTYGDAGRFERLSSGNERTEISHYRTPDSIIDPDGRV
jgi:hypothetical protein